MAGPLSSQDRAPCDRRLRTWIVPDVQLQDSWDRIESAYAEYGSFLGEIDKAMHSQIRRMVRPSPDGSKDTIIRLLTPKEMIELTKRPRVLATQITENLRSALDYIVFHLSEQNDVGLNHRIPAFVIADDVKRFQQSGSPLKYLTPEQKQIVATLQPYNGHLYMQLIRDASNRSKHRRLLTLNNLTSTKIVIDDAVNANKYDQRWWHFPQQNGSTIFVKRGSRSVEFLKKYDAVPCLKYMLECTRGVVWAFEQYLFTGKFPTIITTGSYTGPGEEYSVTAETATGSGRTMHTEGSG